MVNILKFRAGKRHEDAPSPSVEIGELKILGSERVFGDRYGREISESSILYYVYEGRPHQVTIALTWETLAQLRQEATRHGRFISDPELIEAVVQHWGHERLEETYKRGEEPPEEGYLIAFDGPYSSEPRQLLERSGLI